MKIFETVLLFLFFVTKDKIDCLPSVGSCQIKLNAGNASANVTDGGHPQSTYSCVANDNCENEVHIIGTYDGNGTNGWRSVLTPEGTYAYKFHRTTGDSDLFVTVTGTSSRPLILVLSSYEPNRWTLHLPKAVIISKLLIYSYINNTVSYPPGQVLAVESDTRRSRFFGYGSDSGGGNTQGLLTKIYNRFGNISSFTGTYRADVWRLNINRTHCGGKKIIQLKMHPVLHCSEWNVEMADDMEVSIKMALVQAVKERCECQFESSAIHSGEFRCQKSGPTRDHVTYRAIIGNTNTLKAAEAVEHLQEWRMSTHTFLHEKFRLKMVSTKVCPLTVESFENDEC